MKRNIDLIRSILLAIEMEPAGTIIRSLKIESQCQPSPEELIGHLQLAYDAGFINGEMRLHSTGVAMAFQGLTNSGHDLLDSIRSEKVWEATKEKTKELGGSVALETIKAVAIAIATKILLS